MKPGAGKRKGSSFEREVARDLSNWLTMGQDSTQLIRSVLSGGWSRGQTSSDEGWRHVGDLAPNGPVGEKFRRAFAVECKHRRGIDLMDLWTKDGGENLVGWWLKLKEDAAAENLSPMLVFRPNRQPTMVIIPQGTPLAGFSQMSFSRFAIDIISFKELLANQPAWIIPNWSAA